MSKHASAIIAHLNPINVDHRYYDPEYLAVYLLQLVHKAFHHPTSHTLTWVLPRHHHHRCFAVLLLVYQ